MRKITPLLATLVLLLAITVPAVSATDRNYIVIVNESVDAKMISVPELKRIFTKKRSHWGDGKPIVTVEQGGSSTARVAFYRTVLHSSVAQMSTYWINQTMTNGLAPPKIHTNARRVVSYVARTPGAIAFIDANTDLPSGVKRIVIK